MMWCLGFDAIGRLLRGGDFYDAAIVAAQDIAVAQYGAAQSEDGDIFTRGECGAQAAFFALVVGQDQFCLLYTSPSPRDLSTSRMPSSA